MGTPFFFLFPEDGTNLHIRSEKKRMGYPVPEMIVLLCYVGHRKETEDLT